MYLFLKCTSPLGVQYYENAGSNNWTLQEANYEIMDKDIVDKLDPPEWSMKGSRFFNVFKDL